MTFTKLLLNSAAGALLASTIANGAAAQTFDVKPVEVTKGALDFGIDNTFHRGVPHDRGSDINRSAHDIGLDYGLLAWWRISGVIKLENVEEDELRASRVAFENLFVLRPVDDRKPFDIGLGWFTAVEASIHPDTTNALVFGPIVAIKSDKIVFTANPFFEQTFGRNSVDGIAFTYGWNAKYEIREGFALGIEGYGLIENIGNPPPWSEQEHRIGPAIFTEFKLGNGLTIAPDIGLLFGMTHATPDVALKLNIGVPLIKPAGG
ncbi:MAG TPA: hypothetical protein PK264_04755 [Hyphomicrobiaceae bacterium]|nr:hypothetical protein [Hyphomicrobiaceae bacterium]